MDWTIYTTDISRESMDASEHFQQWFFDLDQLPTSEWRGLWRRLWVTTIAESRSDDKLHITYTNV